VWQLWLDGGGDVTDEWESCSSEDEDSDGSWIDVHHSSDEEQVNIYIHLTSTNRDLSWTEIVSTLIDNYTNLFLNTAQCR